MTSTLQPPRGVAEEPPWYTTAPTAAPFAEATLTALWLLGRIPPRVLREAIPYPLLRPGRAGRGPGPDVREAAFLTPSGVLIAGDVEVHLRASDFVRHGHAADPAYADVVLHLCWEDDRAAAGTPTALPGGGAAPTVALASWLSAMEVERLVALGPDVAVASPPCAATPSADASSADAQNPDTQNPDAITVVRAEGRRRLAERTWRAWRLADRYGFDGALTMLLERAVASSAGRVRESEARRATVVAGILDALGGDPVGTLAGRVTAGRAALIEVVRAGGLGAARAAEVSWNVAVPLVAALSAAYDDVPLARATAALAEDWPAPRPYGRTRALDAAVTGAVTATDHGAAGGRPARRGALYAQGLLHLQDLWCSRGGCGVCPLSPAEAGATGATGASRANGDPPHHQQHAQQGQGARGLAD